MISTKILDELNTAARTFREEEEFTEVVDALSNEYKKIENHLSGMLAIKDTSTLTTQKEAIKNSIMSGTNSALRKAKFSVILSATQKIKHSLSNSEIPLFKSITLRIDEFIEAMDENLHSASLNNSIKLTKSAFLLKEKLHEIFSSKETLALTISTQKQELPTISIYIPNEITLESFSHKLEAIASILEICCRLLDMSTSEGLVSIEKIESGSFFARISANQLVIALATIIVTNGSQYIYNELDSSKDLNNLKEASEILEKTLTIRDFLEKNNFDTSEMDEEIKNSSTLLAKSLGRLISNSSEIEINDRKIKTPSSREISSSHIKQLENKQDINSK